MTFVQAIILALISLIGIALTALGTIYVARLAAKSTRQAAQGATDLGWAERADARIEKVETRQAELEAKVATQDRIITALAGYVDALLWWIKTGEHGLMPRPPAVIHDHLDPNLIDQDNGGEAAS